MFFSAVPPDAGIPVSMSVADNALSIGRRERVADLFELPVCWTFLPECFGALLELVAMLCFTFFDCSEEWRSSVYDKEQAFSEA